MLTFPDVVVAILEHCDKGGAPARLDPKIDQIVIIRILSRCQDDSKENQKSHRMETPSTLEGRPAAGMKSKVR